MFVFNWPLRLFLWLSLGRQPVGFHCNLLTVLLCKTKQITRKMRSRNILRASYNPRKNGWYVKSGKMLPSFEPLGTARVPRGCLHFQGMCSRVCPRNKQSAAMYHGSLFQSSIPLVTSCFHKAGLEALALIKANYSQPARASKGDIPGTCQGAQMSFIHSVQRLHTTKLTLPCALLHLYNTYNHWCMMGVCGLGSLFIKE